jgi:hypothetical protein
MAIEELRKADRFVVVEPIPATFGSTDVALLDFSLGGTQITHAQPLRIGTTGRLVFNGGDGVVTMEARVVWSHLAASTGGKVSYRTGLHLEAVDAPYAMAVNSLLRAGKIRRDRESLDRKRQREIEREQKRQSGPKPIPSAR